MDIEESILPRRGHLTGRIGEITVSADGTQAYVHDGKTVGGNALGGGAGGSGKWAGGLYTGLVATRCKSPTNGVTNNKSHMSRSIHVARTAITQLGCAFANWYVSGSGELAIGGDCLITASIEYPLGGNIYRLTFGGQNQGTALDYTTIVTDMLSISIPAGDQFAVREWRNYTSGGGVVFTNQVGIDAAHGDCYSYGASVQTDLTGTPGAFAGGDGMSYSRPVAIFGPTTSASYALIGDSRGEGYGDTYSGNLYTGIQERSIGPFRAFTNLCKFGETAQTAANLGFRQRAAIISLYCSHILCGYGINDIFSLGQNADVVLKSIDQIRTQFPNKWFHQITNMGEVGSTDGWTTLGNEATLDVNKDALRRWMNNYLRSPAALGRFDATFDVSSVLESSFNSGIWKVPGYTGDGLHPNATGYAAVAASGVIVPA